MNELFKVVVGSHMWKMERPDSDIDYNIIYLAPTTDILVGKTIRGKFVQEGKTDTTYYELGEVVQQLIKGNVNYIWMVSSPIVEFEHAAAKRKLYQIFTENLSCASYHSIMGMAKHNLYHFIELGDRDSDIYKKKLNVIGRTLQFGINLLLYGKVLFEKTAITKREELDTLVIRLNEAYTSSPLPEKTNEEPFLEYLLEYRLGDLEEESF